jgi:hypothetical protein
MYYIAKVNFESIDDKTGRIKNIKEEYLVEGSSVSDVEDKMIKKFGEGMSDFSVKEVKESRILGVIE